MSLALLGELDAIAASVSSELYRGKSVIVVGPTGSGRLTLASKLQRALGPHGVHVSLPPFQGHDGPAHGLLQIAAALNEEAMEIARDTARPIGERAAALATIAAREARVIVVRLPESWRLLGLVSASRARREANARAFFAGLTGGGASVVVIAHEESAELAGDLAERLELPPPAIEPGALADAARWGAYGPAFERVRACVGAERLSPIQFRGLVGAAALGQDPDELVATLAAGIRDLRPVIDAIVERLLDPGNRPIADAFVRLASARFPVDRTLALAVAAPPAGHTPFFTECIAYEHDGALRLPDQVRAEISFALRKRRPGWRTHDALAAHHRSRDGAVQPPRDASKIMHWLERAHHLGHMALHGEAEWESLSLAGPEQILDRAWSLSAEYRQFARAAALYERVLKADPKDAYAWHYLGFNLERTGAPRVDVERAYRNAIERDSANPWWNARLVTFLIKDLRYDAADREWAKSLERVDPNGTRVRRDPLLARHFHCWVVNEWLDAGEVERAARAYRMIPRQWLGEHVVLERLRQRFEDALEAVALGESVYPADFPIAKRWLRPVLLERTWGGQELADWMPGRVLSVDAEGVTFVGALVQSERRVFKRTVAATEWTEWSGSAAEPDQFFEMGFYGEERAMVRVRLVNAAPDVDEDDEGYEVLSGGALPTDPTPA
ncbi:MAG: hypothetical protein KIT84_02085 [Labilithrix sp.]|nr:hypothetical protein [Labilithrix sp.]